MKNMLLVVFLVSIPVSASTWSGKVVEIESMVTVNGVIFTLSGVLENTPRCNEEKRYFLNLSTLGGRISLDMLKIAVAEGIMVQAEGLGTCSGLWDNEDVKTIRLYPK